jgi:hypothetical protein
VTHASEVKERLILAAGTAIASIPEHDLRLSCGTHSYRSPTKKAPGLRPALAFFRRWRGDY